MKGCPKCGQRFLEGEEFCPQDGETLVEIDANQKDPLVGTTLDGRYLIQQKLGEGGMGIVYQATHALIGKKCAVKVLRGDVAGDASVAERFIQEARSAAAIGNEHIIEINDFGQTPEGSPYFVMEFLDGAPLHAILKESPKLTVERALSIVDQCCEALAQAHAVGVVHRDLKPENLILVKRGSNPDFVKVLDFGIAKVARESGRLTRTGTIFGTPQYMAPEQAAGTAIDERVDIYALGIILYEMLSGRVPFEADTFMGVLTKHLYEAPIPPSELIPPVEIPRSVESIILKAIAKKPERRFQSMAAFGEEIHKVMAGETPECYYEDIRNSTLPPSPATVVGATAPRRTVTEIADEELPSPGRSRLPVYIGAGVLAVALAIGAWLLLGSGSRESSTASHNPGSGRTAEIVPSPERVPLSPSGGGGGPARELPSADEGNISITLSSKPGGAVLYRDGAEVGRLPLKVSRPSGIDEKVVYTLKREGFQDLDVTVTPTMPEEFVAEMMPAIPEESPRELPTTETEIKRDPGGQREPAAEGKKKRREKKKKKKRLGGDIVDPWG